MTIRNHGVSGSSIAQVLVSATVLAVVFGFVVLTTFTVTWFQPKIYAAHARIKVAQPNSSQSKETPATGLDPVFLTTQIEIIQSQKILYPVVERLKLREQWGRRYGAVLPADMAFRRLRDRLSVHRFCDTSLIEICIEDEEPYMASDIANAIATEFDRYHLERVRQQTGKIEPENGSLQSPIEIIDEAVAQIQPVKPNIFVNLIFGAIAGLIFGLLLAVPAWFIMGRLTKKPITK